MPMAGGGGQEPMRPRGVHRWVCTRADQGPCQGEARGQSGTPPRTTSHIAGIGSAEWSLCITVHLSSTHGRREAGRVRRRRGSSKPSPAIATTGSPWRCRGSGRSRVERTLVRQSADPSPLDGQGPGRERAEHGSSVCSQPSSHPVIQPLKPQPVPTIRGVPRQ